jgi:hypothetical protein
MNCAPGCEQKKIFENLVASAARLSQVATLCRPDSRNEKIKLKLSRIGLLKNIKNGFDRPVDRSVELGFGLCFQQNLMGVGPVAEGRRQRAAESP